MPEAIQLKPDIDFIRQVKAAGGDSLKQCYQCATCSIVCNLASTNHPFPRKQMIMAQWGLKDRLLSDPSIWMCHQCNDCSIQCPREARPGDVLAALRGFSFRHFAFPSFLGKALANPGALPILFLVPAIILLFVLLGSSSGDLGYLFQFTGKVDYAKPFPHGAMDAIFVTGNILVFACAAFGLLRLWKGMKKNYPDSKKIGFISAVISTVREIGFHNKFSQCGTYKSRYLGHLLIFYGFIGAFLATTLNFFFTVILKFLGSPWYLESPINFPNPIKLLGILGGIAILIGGWILIQRRRSKKEEIVFSGYSDWLFLIVISLVALTGLFAWLFRIAGIPILAYFDYYLHLILVFFLLWYAPYSKFGHMFYRTLALIYAKSTGLDNPRKNGDK